MKVLAYKLLKLKIHAYLNHFNFLKDIKDWKFGLNTIESIKFTLIFVEIVIISLKILKIESLRVNTIESIQFLLKSL